MKEHNASIEHRIKMHQLFADWLELKPVKASLKKVATEANKIFREKKIKHQCFDKSIKREISSVLKDKEDGVHLNKAKARLLIMEEVFSKFVFPRHENGPMMKGASMVQIFQEYYSANKTFHTDWTKAAVHDFLEKDDFPNLVKLIVLDLVKNGKLKT